MKDLKQLLTRLETNISGEVRADVLSRAMYATDGSIYEIVPDAVVLPKTAEDVAATVRFCADHGVPITARGAGTGLTGGAVNRGIILDCSHYLKRVSDVDPQGATACVQPGVVLDELNARLAPHGLHFAPDVATSNRATLGGMIANNSCGAHSIVFGRTVDHVEALDVVLADGTMHRWGLDASESDNPLAQTCDAVLSRIAREDADEIAARFPKVRRNNGGYGLDRLVAGGGRCGVERVLCGSEGTLGIVVGARVKLTPLPRHKALLLVFFHELLEALAATPVALEHRPAAVELVDRLILDATRANPAMARRRWFIEGDPEAILLCELYDEREDLLKSRLARLEADLSSRGIGYARRPVIEHAAQADAWYIRKAGLGLLMSKPGDRQPYAFVEDTAVDPVNLRNYIERFAKVLAEEGVDRAGYYAHVGAGCVHVRPALNLKLGEDVRRMRRIADRISTLAMEFGGTMTGEHGDGILRSGWLEKLYGPKIVDAFRNIKHTFDPQNILNPGKIVAPLPMTENLRYGETFESIEVPTHLDFSSHGGMAGLAAMCTGVGLCRQTQSGTMCPSYMATGDEKHTTRARANALRIALSNRDLIHDLDDPALAEVLDLCLSCKACKTECPTRTDVAKLKAEWLAHWHCRHGVPPRSRLVASSIELAQWGSLLAPISNWVMQSKPVRAYLERRFGLDSRMPPPRYARTTFRKWFYKRARHLDKDKQTGRPPVVYFVDTWTNHHLPEVGKAAVRVLEALGYRVIVPPTVCCGRPLISKGLLAEARLLAEENVKVLAPFAHQGVPIVGTEPSCLLTLVDEFPQFVRWPIARKIAERALTIEAFVGQALKRDPQALRFREGQPSLLYHGHCHQKALVGTEEAMYLLNACSGGRAKEIDSGCCGMAGSFGHEAEHYDVAKAIGEQRLFPAVRGRGDAQIAVSGFSCTHQIDHHTGVRPRHVIEYVAIAALGGDRAGEQVSR